MGVLRSEAPDVGPNTLTGGSAKRIDTRRPGLSPKRSAWLSRRWRPFHERLPGLPRLRCKFESATVPIIASAWLMGWLLAIVMLTPYGQDDLTNMNIREIAHAAGQSLPGYWGDQITWWMVNEGRFFPGSVAWTSSIFWVFGSRIAYKLIIGVVLMGAIAVLGLFISRLTGRWKAGLAYIAIILGLIQLRTPHDGVIGFAALVPLTMGLTIAAMVILVSRRGMGWITLGAFFYSFALVTYETVFVFAPIMVAIVVRVRRAWLPALAIAIPAFVQLGIVAILRVWMHPPITSGYTVNLEPLSVLATFGKQVFAALPLSQWAFSANVVPTISGGSIAVGLLVAGMPTFLSVASLGRSPIRAGRMEVILIAALGVWMWLSSSALIAITWRWQVELSWGQGYLSVIYGYFGVGLLLLSLYLFVDRIVADRAPRSIPIWRYGSALLISVTASLTMAGNLSIYN